MKLTAKVWRQYLINNKKRQVDLAGNEHSQQKWLQHRILTLKHVDLQSLLNVYKG